MPRPMPDLKSLLVLEDLIAGCSACPLNDGYHLPVPGVLTHADRPVDLFLLAEAPGQEESDPEYFDPGSKYGAPMVGPAGNALQELMLSLGFADYSMFVTNVVKHRPPNNRPPSEDEKHKCKSFLLYQLQAIHPRAVIAFGKHASEAMRQIALQPPQLSGVPARGHHFDFELSNPIRVFNVYHPSYALLRRPEMATCLADDLKHILYWLQEESSNA